MSARLLVILAAPWIGAASLSSGAFAGEPGRLPTFVRLDRAGGFATASVSSALPPVPDLIPVLPDRSPWARSAPDPSRLRVMTVTPSLPAVSALELSREEDGEEPLSRPGMLSTRFVTMPSPVPVLKSHSLGPHLRPDAEFDLSDRTSIGFIGKLDGFGTSDVTSLLSRSLPAVAGAKSSAAPVARPREIGFGATLEFKLGQ
ncbi:hypothetical protein [Enterovirga sp.]|uniref:hypothetical protein n=1 Tax=Enterovirga sp. TaxID=2026350 RepID=UPI002C383E80|nr:hypothetical protein [Enterovirga sp.]HMO28159.1 hypothetical protein [Enterovirga sp.]